MCVDHMVSGSMGTKESCTLDKIDALSAVKSLTIKRGTTFMCMRCAGTEP